MDIVLKFIKEACSVEDALKQTVRLLVFVRDTKAAANNEAIKTGLLNA